MPPMNRHGFLISEIHLGIETDQNRDGSTYAQLEIDHGKDRIAECRNICGLDDHCLSWSFNHADNNCFLKNDVPLNSYMPGFTSGIKGEWKLVDKHAIMLDRAGAHPARYMQTKRRYC